jgi:membrane protein required for colicin V production
MNGLDIAILVAFFISVLIGALRGFTKEFLSLFSWGGAVTLSYVFLPIGRSLVSPYIANPMMADGAAIFCLFIISLILLSIVANIIAGYIHESSFRGVDHSLGFGFGILRGVIFISAAELIFSTFSPRHAQSSTFQTARFIPMARKGGDTLLQILPGSAREWILDQAIKVENQLNAKVKENIKNEIEGYAGAQKDNNPALPPPPYHPEGQPPGQPFPPSLPLTIHGHPGDSQPQYRGAQAQSQMSVIRPPQPGQTPQLGAAPESASIMANPGNQAGAVS